MMGNLDGLGIIVSDTATEGNTAASFALRSPAEVVQFLDHFAQVPCNVPQAMQRATGRATCHGPCRRHVPCRRVNV